MHLLTNVRYHNISDGISFDRLDHAHGWDLGVPLGVGGGGGVKKIFPEIKLDLVCELHEWHLHQHNFWVPCPWGLVVGSKI